jgi:hypothetical protein
MAVAAWRPSRVVAYPPLVIAWLAEMDPSLRWGDG